MVVATAAAPRALTAAAAAAAVALATIQRPVAMVLLVQFHKKV